MEVNGKAVKDSGMRNWWCGRKIGNVDNNTRLQLHECVSKRRIWRSEIWVLGSSKEASKERGKGKIARTAEVQPRSTSSVCCREPGQA